MRFPLLLILSIVAIATVGAFNLLVLHRDEHLQSRGARRGLHVNSVPSGTDLVFSLPRDAEYEGAPPRASPGPSAVLEPAQRDCAQGTPWSSRAANI